MKDYSDTDTQQATGLLAALLERADSQGFLTTDDILEAIPDGDDAVERLGDVLRWLQRVGVEVYEDRLGDDDLARADDEDLEADDDEAFDLSGVSSDDTVGLYLKEMARVPLLSNDEEVDLARRLELGNEARAELMRLGDSASPERIAQLNDLIEDGKAARDHLIKANTRLVVSIAKKYMGRGVHFLDLIQEGNLGLMKAVEKFDYTRGFRFSTYATWWIRQSISRYILENARTIRIPVHMVEQISKLVRIQHNLVQSLGRDPTFAEMAVNSGFLSEEDVESILEIGGSRELADPGLLHRWDEATQKVESVLKTAEEPVSLESPIGDADNSTLADYIEDQDAEEPIEEILRDSLKDTIRTTLGSLPEKQRQVLELRFGLVDGVYHSLEEVSQRFGLTRERIRQIESSALRRLRDPSRSNPLQDFVDRD